MCNGYALKEKRSVGISLICSESIFDTLTKHIRLLKQHINQVP